MSFVQSKRFSVVKCRIMHDFTADSGQQIIHQAVLTLKIGDEERKTAAEAGSACGALLAAFKQALPEVGELAGSGFPQKDEKFDGMVQKVIDYFDMMFEFQTLSTGPSRRSLPSKPTAAACAAL